MKLCTKNILDEKNRLGNPAGSKIGTTVRPAESPAVALRQDVDGDRALEALQRPVVLPLLCVHPARAFLTDPQGAGGSRANASAREDNGEHFAPQWRPSTKGRAKKLLADPPPPLSIHFEIPSPSERRSIRGVMALGGKKAAGLDPFHPVGALGLKIGPAPSPGGHRCWPSRGDRPQGVVGHPREFPM